MNKYILNMKQGNISVLHEASNMDVLNINDLKGSTLLAAIKNYIGFIESDMEASAWEYNDKYIPFEDFAYSIKQMDFNDKGDVL